MKNCFLVVIGIIYLFIMAENVESANSFEDRRCRCVCPTPAAALNHSSRNEQQEIIADVPASQCNCDGVILPWLGKLIKGREDEICPRCDCKFETRNTSVIKLIVFMVLWIIFLLLVYMVFVMLLEPLLRGSKNKYQDEAHFDEEMKDLMLHTDD